ncbi:HAD family hydrolase [Parahaliea sp. F7430]|uniref:HAD family hydrolase n=1 Tax=Sediminihaliea albiluteola TaxID=2758564 RepID=A0A7W2TY06_9GAMM|nr:HAD family hydrolase [Sediminihaliea albiluteola]MBA6414011.1 HAD family hydrolase [Sediminihaliea albiluteola]
MLKALFLDMDETLCDTLGANAVAKQKMAQHLRELAGTSFDAKQMAEDYVDGIYRHWSDSQRERYLPIIEQSSEGEFRVQLILDLLHEQGIHSVDSEAAQDLQQAFDRNRLEAFDFYPGIPEFLLEARELFTLVVITNGPEFSQIPKVEKIKLADYVDHIIIGGQEPEQKPASSIFEKALKLAQCEAHEAIHVGDSLAADIAGADYCGITTVWVQHQQALDAELGINPQHSVFHPSEIPALIRELHSNGHNSH